MSDIIPPKLAAITDACALLRFGAANGFLLAALGGLFATLFSDYRQLRSRLGLSRYSEAAMLHKLSLSGYSVNRTAVNIGHNQSRMAFYASPLVKDGKFHFVLDPGIRSFFDSVSQAWLIRFLKHRINEPRIIRLFFPSNVTDFLHRSLRRRSQKDRLPGPDQSVADDFLPQVRILHPCLRANEDDL